VQPCVDWPADLAAKKLAVFTEFGHEGITYQAPLRWGTGDFLREVLLGPDPGQVRHLAGDGMSFWRLAARGASGFDPSAPIYADGTLLNRVQGDVENGGWERGKYNLKRLVVLQPTSLPSPPEETLRYRLLALASSRFQGGAEPVTLHEKPPGEPGILGGSVGLSNVSGIALSASSSKLWEITFSAEPGKPNEWRIALPEELITAVRETLTAEPEGKQK